MKCAKCGEQQISSYVMLKNKKTYACAHCYENFYKKPNKDATVLLIGALLYLLAVIAVSVGIMIYVPSEPVEALETPKMETVERVEEEPAEIIHGVVYGYNSIPNQTDDTPFITASQQRVREGIIANNCLPFGAKVLVDGIEYEVQDRMNKRYGCEVFDIWFAEYDDAINWGKRNMTIKILSTGSI